MYKYLRERSKHDRARLFLVVFSDRTRGKRDLNTGNSTSKRKKKCLFWGWSGFFAYFVEVFYGESHQTSAQAAQRGCAIPILGDIQALTDHVPEKPALGVWTRGVWTR